MHTLAGSTQHLPGGAIASQEAIKDLGTNGGGPFNANAAHPFENPNGFTNLLIIFLLTVIPFSLPATFGRMVGNLRQGYTIVAVMGLIWLGFVVACYAAEFAHPGAALQLAGGAMEGKETRFGVSSSPVFAVSTTLTSTGSVNSMHDSFTALGGGVAILAMLLGEVAPGGVGSGLYGMLVLAVVAVFVAGLMVGRTPEYLGKKIRAREMKLVALYILTVPLLVLIGTGLALALPTGRSSILNPGAHGLSEVLYAFASASNNNGSAFAGLTAGTPFYDVGFGTVHVVRPVRPDRVRPRAGRVTGPAEAGAGDRRDATDQLATVRGHAHRRHHHRHRPDVLPRPGPRSACGRPVMSTSTSRTHEPHQTHEAGAMQAQPELASQPGGHHRVAGGAFDPSQLLSSLPQAFAKLDPRTMVRSPVMFVVEVGAVLSTGLTAFDSSLFGWLVVGWLWLTVLFANLAEAVAEGRGKAQADTLRRARTETLARRLGPDHTTEEQVPGTALHVGDLVVCEAGDVIPGDGEVIDGIASVDESAITGESAPVIRESGGDRSAVTGGTKVLSDRIVVRITSEPGETFIDRMISLVEGADRQKTPNEVALTILLASLTIIFLLAIVTLQPMAGYSGQQQSILVLVALLVCLIPTTIGALLSAIGIAGMDRLVQRNVLAMSGRAVEAAGDVSTLLLDKTGTITLGARQAVDFVPVGDAGQDELANAAQLASLADETPEGRSVVVLAKEKFGLRGRELSGATVLPFTAETRMSGVDQPDGHQIRKGAASAVLRWVQQEGGTIPPDTAAAVDEISLQGGTPLLVAERRTNGDDGTDGNTGTRVLGVVHLKDVVKAGLRERFDDLRAMGIRTVMITGDNPLTARAIAAEAGVDDFLAEATPEDKMALIRREQEGGKLVAMTGDGTNDAPALAAADVGVAMNTGTPAAKEAGNMVDLDSNPTKLIEIVEIGKQLLITRGALTTFSIANDVAKYFAIIPAMFAAVYPGLGLLNIMGLSTPESAILSAVIFNALIIVVLIPLALRGVRYRPTSASAMLRRNLWVYGLGGIVVPFIGIKAIDMLISLIPGIR